MSPLMLRLAGSLSMLAVATPLPAQDPAVARIDRFLREHLTAIPIPGFSAVVVKDGRVILARGYGREVAGRSAPMTERSPIAIGSLTKSFTAVAMMRLVEQGQVDLDAPVTRYLPWFRTADRRGAEITVRMLLTNTSGIPSTDRWLFSRDTAESAIEASVRDLSRVPVVRQPGLSFEYANENWSVAGAIITAVTGLPYSAALEREVLEPLGMRHSSTALARFREIGALWGHAALPSGVRPAGPRFIAAALPAGSELRVSAADMGRYLQMLLDHGVVHGRPFLRAPSVAALFQSGSTTIITMPEMGVLNAESGYGLGWGISEADGRTIIQHGGDAIVMGSWTAIDTAGRIGAAIFYGGPALDPYRYPSKIWVVNNLLHLARGEPLSDFGMPKEADPTRNDYELPAELATRYLGQYRSASGARLAIRTEGDRLLANLRGGNLTIEYQLDFASEAAVVFRNIAGGMAGRFQVTAGGQVTGLTGSVIGGPFKKLSADEVSRRREVVSPDGALAFPLPADWVVTWRGTRFIAAAPGGAVTVTGDVRADPWQGYVDGLRKRATLTERSETVGQFLWREAFWVEGAGPSARQEFAAHAEIGGRGVRIEATAPPGGLTPVIREVVLPLLSELEPRGTNLGASEPPPGSA